MSQCLFYETTQHELIHVQTTFKQHELIHSSYNMDEIQLENQYFKGNAKVNTNVFDM